MERPEQAPILRTPTMCFLTSEELPPSEKLRAFNEGIDFIVSKPIKPKVFKKLIAHAKKKSRA